MDDQEQTSQAPRPYLLLGVAAAPLLIVVLSLPALDRVQLRDRQGLDNDLPAFSFSLDGTESAACAAGTTPSPPTSSAGDDRCTCRVDFGDGYITAGLGLVLLAVAGAGTRSYAAVSRRLVAIAHDRRLRCLRSWSRATTRSATGSASALPTIEDIFVNLDGTVQPGLWALVAASVTAAVLGAVIWSLDRAGRARRGRL